MRLVLGMFSLVVVLAVVGMLAKKQLGALAVSQKAAFANQAAAGTAGSSGVKNPQLQTQPLQEQVRQSLETAMQRPKAVDGE